ncbi:hypothetical protein SNE40_011476 [Patella caerulea]|uniref:Arrestin C-terminal-like domain-containing protein n=1 Tax=Patella caerulea TaxID=87958 RepID=A0AAN8JJY4_PATCE
MVKQENFELIYSSSNSTYSSGESVKGQVSLILEDPMKIRGIRVTFFGKARVKWTERLKTEDGERKETEIVEQTAEEVYFNERLLIWGEDVDSEHNEILTAGKHNFPFNFQLPEGLPSSFESRHGYVRYYARATIDKAWKKDDHVQKPFIVLGHHDLNKAALATGRFHHSAEETVCCGCCRMGVFGVELSMAKRGFVVGDEIELTAQINNHTRTACVSHLLMKMTITLRSTDKVKTEEVIIGQASHVTHPGVTDTWISPFQIPDVPPSGLAGCGIIDPKYNLQYTLEPSGCNCDSIEVCIGIIVGTVPVQTGEEKLAPKVSNEDL